MRDYAEDDNVGTIQSTSIINFILGAWLIVSPFWLNYTSTAARWNQVILGIIVMALAAIRAFLPRLQGVSFLIGLAMIWAIIAPFILSYDRSVAYWNEIIVAIVVGILAFWNSSIHALGDGRHHHHAV